MSLKVTHESVATHTESSPGASASYSHVLAQGSGNARKVDIFASMQGTSSYQVSGITFDGVACTFVASDNNASVIRGAWFKILDADLPAAAGSYTVVVSFDSTVTEVAIISIEKTQIKQSASENNIGTSTGGGTSGTATIGPDGVNDAPILFIAIRGNSGDVVPDPAFSPTERAEVETGTGVGDAKAEFQDREGISGSNQLGATWTSTTSRVFLFGINEHDGPVVDAADGTATVVAAGTVINGAVLGESTIQSVATIVAAASVIKTGDSTINAISTIVATAVVVKSADSTINALATIISVAMVQKPGQATLSAIATLGQTGGTPVFEDFEAFSSGDITQGGKWTIPPTDSDTFGDIHHGVAAPTMQGSSWAEISQGGSNNVARRVFLLSGQFGATQTWELELEMSRQLVPSHAMIALYQGVDTAADARTDPNLSFLISMDPNTSIPPGSKTGIFVTDNNGNSGEIASLANGTKTTIRVKITNGSTLEVFIAGSGTPAYTGAIISTKNQPDRIIIGGTRGHIGAGSSNMAHWDDIDLDAPGGVVGVPASLILGGEVTYLALATLDTIGTRIPAALTESGWFGGDGGSF